MLAHARTGRAGPDRASPLRRMPFPDGSPSHGTPPPGAPTRVPLTGAPLTDALRRSFEPQFGHDFSQVRIHTDAAADASARELGAQAWTTGNDIVFADGMFRPDSSAGRRLVAHELAHVVQGAAGRRGAQALVPVPGNGGPMGESAPSEREADRMADLADAARSDGSPAWRLGSVAVPEASIQRKPATGSATPDPMEHVQGSLYARGPDGALLPPSLEDISQGGLSDCFLMAALAAIVSTDPMLIKTMIAFGPNGTYTVTFRGIGFWNSAKQTVTADFAVGKHANLGPRKALWPLVIERAYAQEKGGLDVVNKGGNPGGVVDDMINDSPSRFDPREETADYIMGKVAKGKAKKWPMTILSPKQGDASAEKKAMTTRIPGLHFWHSYAIIDVDAKKNRIKLFNPWGNSHPNNDGWIDVADVRKFFIEISIND